jgi:hypothetical protein
LAGRVAWSAVVGDQTDVLGPAVLLKASLACPA